MLLQLVPVSAYASLWLALHDPKPFDAGVVFVAHAADHAVVVQGVDNRRLILGSLLTPLSLHEERIIVAFELLQQLVLFQSSGVLDGIVGCPFFALGSADADRPCGLGQGRRGPEEDASAADNLRQGCHFAFWSLFECSTTQIGSPA